MATLTTAELRRRNRNQIFRYIYAHTECVTKQEIAQQLSLSLPTVTQNLKELMDMGCIEYVGTLDSTGGRKPKTIGVRAGARRAIGIMISRSRFYLICVNLKGEIECKKRLDIRFRIHDEYSRALGGALEAFLDENQVDRESLLGVGIALPGIINAAQGTVELAHTMVPGILTKEQLTRYITYPCWLENDANAGGVAEWWNRPDPGSMVYLSVQRGVGGAVLLEGVRYMGRHHRSGEFGHMCIVKGGRQCNCGRRGCLEAYCSTARISDDLGVQLEDFFTGLELGNERYRQAWNDYLDYLALGINNIRMVLDCDVALGGLLAHFMEPYMPELQRRIQDLNSFGSDGSYLRLCRYLAWSTGVGAALHFVADFLETI